MPESRTGKARTVGPLPIALLAVDPGAVSGWSLWLNGVYQDSGEARTHAARRAAVESLISLAESAEEGPVLITEQWNAGGFRTHQTLIGLGIALGRWAECADAAGLALNRRSTVSVPTWRAYLFGSATLPGPEAKRRAAALGERTAGRSVGVDEGEAIAIGVWARDAAAVADLLPASRRARYLDPDAVRRRALAHAAAAERAARRRPKRSRFPTGELPPPRRRRKDNAPGPQGGPGGVEGGSDGST